MKRFLVLCLTAVMCYAAVTGTVAYFTDSVETSNIVASGNLQVVQHEYERDGSGVKPFQQEKPLYPAVGKSEKGAGVTVNGHEVSLESGLRNYVDKIVTAENRGSLQMYVRTYIAVPSFSDAEGKEPWIHLDVNTAAQWEYTDEPILCNVMIDNRAYDIYMATYPHKVEPNGITPPSLLGFYMDSHVTNDGDGLVFVSGGTKYSLGSDSNMKILVASAASQAAVFGSVDEAMNATYPKDSEGREIYHPWKDNFHFAATQEALDAALTAAQNQYDTIISLSDGAYVIPGQLPAGLTITGAGAEVVLNNAAAINANDVEFCHLSFQNALTFSGWGVFENVTFAEGSVINAAHDTVLVDCENVPAYTGNVSVVFGVPQL